MCGQIYHTNWWRQHPVWIKVHKKSSPLVLTKKTFCQIPCSSSVGAVEDKREIRGQTTYLPQHTDVDTDKFDTLLLIVGENKLQHKKLAQSSDFPVPVYSVQWIQMCNVQRWHVEYGTCSSHCSIPNGHGRMHSFMQHLIHPQRTRLTPTTLRKTAASTNVCFVSYMYWLFSNAVLWKRHQLGFYTWEYVICICGRTNDNGPMVHLRIKEPPPSSSPVLASRRSSPPFSTQVLFVFRQSQITFVLSWA